MAHVQRWWAVLFARVRPHLYANGGPIVMVQLENEYGFCGPAYGLERSRRYMRQLAELARYGLGDDVILYTTDPPNLLAEGSLPDGEAYSVVDFGANWGTPEGPWAAMRAFNAPGKSPPFNSEFYTGWLTHWGEPASVANTSMDTLVPMLAAMLAHANATASLNFYMAAGGTNFGFSAGANVAGSAFQPHVTSYDYAAPVSEAGGYGQPGYGGPNKFEAIRSLLQQHTSEPLPRPPPPPKVVSYGSVALGERASMLGEAALQYLSPQGGLRVRRPGVMADYGQRWGFILYRHVLPPGSLAGNAVLEFGSPLHDYGYVLLDGRLVGSTSRSDPRPVVLPEPSWLRDGGNGIGGVVLDVLVQAMGHVNFGCGQGWDRKGMTSGDVTLNGAPLLDWQVFPMELPKVGRLPWRAAGAGDELEGAAAPANHTAGPVFYRGTFSVDERLRQEFRHLPDTFLHTPGWTKGMAWVNGFNLGHYWPQAGPQQSLYVPGPLLHEGANELVLLEVEGGPEGLPMVYFEDAPKYSDGPAAASAWTAGGASEAMDGRAAAWDVVGEPWGNAGTVDAGDVAAPQTLPSYKKKLLGVSEADGTAVAHAGAALELPSYSDMLREASEADGTAVQDVAAALKLLSYSLMLQGAHAADGTAAPNAAAAVELPSYRKMLQGLSEADGTAVPDAAAALELPSYSDMLRGAHAADGTAVPDAPVALELPSYADRGLPAADGVVAVAR